MRSPLGTLRFKLANLRSVHVQPDHATVRRRAGRRRASFLKQAPSANHPRRSACLWLGRTSSSLGLGSTLSSNMTILDSDMPPTTPPTSSDEGEKEEPDYDWIDWDHVVHQQPDQVVAWIEYLHETEQRDAFSYLLRALGRIFKDAHLQPFPQWTVYNQTKLTEVLLDILAEPDMFSREDDTFKVRGIMQTSIAATEYVNRISYTASLFYPSLITACQRSTMPTHPSIPVKLTRSSPAFCPKSNSWLGYSGVTVI